MCSLAAPGAAAPPSLCTMRCSHYSCELTVRGCLERQAARVEFFGLAEKAVHDPEFVVRPKIRTRHPYCARRCEVGRALRAREGAAVAEGGSA